MIATLTFQKLRELWGDHAALRFLLDQAPAWHAGDFLAWARCSHLYTGDPED